jgi:hypothetical protein
MSLAAIAMGCKGAADSTRLEEKSEIVEPVAPGDVELEINYVDNNPGFEWSVDSKDIAPERLIDELERRRSGLTSGRLHVVVWHPKNCRYDSNPTLDAIRVWSRRPNVVYREDLCRGYVPGVTFGKNFKR